MACLSLRAGSDAARQFPVPGVHLPGRHKMKQAFSRAYLWHVSCRRPSRHVRNMASQAVAMEEMEANETNDCKYQRWKEYETKVLIAARNEHNLGKLESLEAAEIESTKARCAWKKIEAICRERGVQRSADQCESRWQRIKATYLQIKSWEQNKTPELLSFWSMQLDERRANGFLLCSMDKLTYNLLDELYNIRTDAVKDSSIKAAVEEVAESGSVEHMLPRQNRQPPLKEGSEVGGTSNTNSLSASEDESCEGHRTSSQNLYTEVNAFDQNQVKWVAGTTVSIEEGYRASSHFSSEGLVISHEKQSGQVAGASMSVEKMREGQRHRGQDAGTAASVEETHEGLSTSVASTEVNVTIEQLSEQAASTAASVPSLDEDGGIGMNYLTENNLEVGDTTNANVLPVFVETTHEKQSGQVAGTAAFVEETHQCEKTSVHVPSTQMESHHERQTGQVTEFAISAEETCESHVARCHFVSTGVDVMWSEQGTGSEFSKNTSVTVHTTAGAQERTLEISHSLPFQECEGLDTVPEHSAGHSSKAVLVGQLQGGSDEGIPNQETEQYGAAVQDKSSNISAEQCGWFQPAHGRTDQSSAVIEEECHTESEERRDRSAEQGILGLGSAEVCEGKGAEGFEKRVTEAMFFNKDDTSSPRASQKGNGKAQDLAIYDARKCDEDVFMYVPAAIGNVMRTVSQTFKKFFKV